MQISVNGTAMQVIEGTTLLEWLKGQVEDWKFLIVEHNGMIVAQQAFQETVLQHGDNVEIFKLVGGG